MIHARRDYTRRIQDSEKLIPKDEPVFLIRGQDEVGYRAVQAWANLHKLNGGSDVAYALAMEHAGKMETWAEKHGKKADVPPEALPVNHPYYQKSRKKNK